MFACQTTPTTKCVRAGPPCSMHFYKQSGPDINERSSDHLQLEYPTDSNRSGRADIAEQIL